MYTVTVDSLTKRFGGFTAVDNVTLNVNRGEIFGFLGPNGAGKSTTIKMLCGILVPTEGSGTVSGYDIVSQQEEIKSSIGYMSQKFSLYPDLTVMENLQFYGSIYGLEGRLLEKQIDTALDMSNMAGMKNELVSILPGGIKQRLALGAAVLHGPSILFLDEPTSGVDPLMRRNFWEIIYRFAGEGKTVFVTTHYMEEAEHCDRIALIISGQVMALDTPAQLKENIGCDVYSVSAPKILEEFDDIAALDFIDEAAVFGSGIHVLAPEGSGAGKKVKVFLRKRGLKNVKVEKAVPALEDVFVVQARRHSGP